MTDYLTVSTLTKYIKYKFDQDPHLQSVLIKGELSNFKKHSSGHLYFNVKDKESVISAMMFKGSASKLNFEPKEGDEVLLEARVSVYERRGNYQIYVNKMQLDGIGNLYQKLEELKKKLSKEGYFDNSNKKTIPRFPKKIAVLLLVQVQQSEIYIQQLIVAIPLLNKYKLVHWCKDNKPKLTL